MGNGESARAGAGDIGRIEENAVGGDEALAEESAPVEKLGGAHAVPRPHPLDLVPTLGKVSVDGALGFFRQVPHLLEERRAAGVRCVGREVAPDPTARVVAVGGGEIQRLVEGRTPDRGDVAAFTSPRNRSHVDVQDAPADNAAEPDFDQGLRERLRMEVVVDDRGRTRAQELVHPEPREGEHFLEAERRALGDPGRVGGGMPQVLHHAAGDHERRVVVNVDEPGEEDPAPRIDRLAAAEAALDLRARSERRDAVPDDRDRSVRDDGPRVVEGEDESVLHHEIACDRTGPCAPCRPRAFRHRPRSSRHRRDAALPPQCFSRAVLRELPWPAPGHEQIGSAIWPGDFTDARCKWPRIPRHPGRAARIASKA